MFLMELAVIAVVFTEISSVSLHEVCPKLAVKFGSLEDLSEEHLYYES